MFRAVKEGFNPRVVRLKDNMSVNIMSANIKEHAYELADKFLGRCVPHILIEEDVEYIGLLSVGHVMKANLRQKNGEFKELDQMVGFERYESCKEIQPERSIALPRTRIYNAPGDFLESRFLPALDRTKCLLSRGDTCTFSTDI